MSDKTENNQAAFPIPETRQHKANGGMSMRQYYAGQALQGMCANPGVWTDRAIKEYASLAFAHADLMINHEKQQDEAQRQMDGTERYSVFNLREQAVLALKYADEMIIAEGK